MARADAAARRAAADKAARARHASTALAADAAADDDDERCVGVLTFDPKTLSERHHRGGAGGSGGGQASVSSVCALGTAQDPETGRVGPARVAVAVRSDVCVWHLVRPEN
jgi:hypothetical protein